METPVKLKSFLFLADALSKSIGLIPYDKECDNQKSQKLLKLIFIILMINMNFVLFVEFMFIVRSIVHGENFAEATMNLSYFGFTFVSNIKILSVLHKKPLLTILMRRVQQMFPTDLKLQKDFDTRRYMIKFNVISFSFVIIHLILIWSYNLYPAVSYLIYDYWLAWKRIPKTLPYYVWVPWQWQDHWSYYFLYISLNMAGYSCMSGQLANDVMLCEVATQTIMHYRYLAQQLETYQPCNMYEHDLKFLRKCIRYHQRILSLSTYMNEAFGVSLLVNFISSSFTMCFLGFQMTIGVQTDTLIMLFIFLFCSLLQILMICYYGEQLMEKSQSIGRAVYNHNWLNTDVRYRKLLVLIIGRSQRPTLLKATTFLNVSMGTMTDLMQLSYKFFALLRTMYKN